MHQQNQQRFADADARLRTIEQRLDTLIRALSVMVESDDLSNDRSMESVVRFREEHRRLLFYDRQFSSLAETIGRWIIRAMITFVFASTVWALSNVEIVRQLWTRHP